MASFEYERGTGGKFGKPLPRRAPSTPYDRPPSAARGLRGTPPAVVSRGSRWLSNIVDPASRVIARSASRLFSSVLRKGLVPRPGENHNTIEDDPEVRPSPEVREGDDNSFDARLSTHCDGSGRDEQESISGTDDIFELEQLVKQMRFSRSETERLMELLQSRTIEASTLPSANYKNKGKLIEDSIIDPETSQQAVNHEDKKNENTSLLEDQRRQLATLHGNISSGVNTNIFAEGFGSPIEIARAYMGSKSLKASPSTLRLKQSQICLRDKGSPLSSPFGNKQSNAAGTSNSAVCFPGLPADPNNYYISPAPHGRSSLYKLPRNPYCRSPAIANTKEYSPYKGIYIGPTKSIEWTPPSSNIRHSVHGQSLKRGSSDNDIGGFGDVRRVRQKSCLKGMQSSSCIDTPSTSSLGQGNNNETDLKGLETTDVRLPSAAVLPIPQSTQMARKILHQLDKLVPSPRNLSSEKKVTFGDASFSNSSLGAFHEGSQKFKGKYCSTKIVKVPGSSTLAEPSRSTLAGIINSAPKDKAKEIEGSHVPSVSGAEATSSSFGMNSAVTSASDANRSMMSMNLDNHGFSFFSTQKDTILQRAPDDKDESTKAEHAIFSYVEESREKSLVHLVEFPTTSGVMYTETGAKDASFKFPAVHTSNSLSKPLLSSTMASTTSADGSTPVEGDTVSRFRLGSTGSGANIRKPLNMGISASVQTGETIIDGPNVKSDKGVSATPALPCDKSVSSTLSASTGISASLSNSCSSSAAPRFQFGSGNSTIYSFTGLSAAFSSIGDVSSMGNGASKFQFGSGNSASNSFAGVAASISQDVGVSSPVFSSLYPVAKGTGYLSTSSIIPISANGIFGISTLPASGGSRLPFAGNSTENSMKNLGATAASSSGTPATFSGNGITKVLHSSVHQFGSFDSQPISVLGSSVSSTCNSQFGFAISGAKPFSSSSCLSSSSGTSSSFFGSSSLSPPVASSFPSVSSPSYSATLGSTPLSSPSTGFSFGMPANASVSMPFVSPSGSILPLVSTGTTTSNDQMNLKSSRADGVCQAAPMDPTSGQQSNLQAVHSGTQVFQLGNLQNNSAKNSSPFQESGNLGFSAGENFSMGSGGTEKSERRFIRVRRDKRRK